jgi:F-type H+-transporting ATPase subunit delta
MTNLRDRLAEVISQDSGRLQRVAAALHLVSPTEDMTDLAQECYAVAGLLTRQPRLRRRLADPTLTADARKNLATGLLRGKISDDALSVVEFAVAQRWSGPWDLVDAFASSGDDVLLAAAESEGVLDALEDELFRLERILDAESGLTGLLDEATVDPARRAALLDSVISNKVHPLTLLLVRQAVTSQRKRSVLLAIDGLIEAAGARRQRSVARVVSAVELSDQQQGDLAEGLSRLYGRRIEVRHAVDPAVRGGLIVHIGDEVIDGSVASRLTELRATFAG